mgnify:CR=1 FL=1
MNNTFKRLLGILAFFCIYFISYPTYAKDTLIVGYNLQPPFVIESGEQVLSGPSVWLWENIAKQNNLVFKYEAMALEELLNGLENNDIDLSLSPLSITAERTTKMDFTSPYHIVFASLLKPAISPLQKSLMHVKSFFSLNFLRALIALAFIILIFGILIWLFEKKHNHQEFGGNMKGIWEGFWWSAVTMTTVGYGDKSPKTIGGRIVSLIWMFTAIIIISGFTASIASSLTINSIGSSKNTLKEFKKHKLGTIKNSATSFWLKNNFFSNKKLYDNEIELLAALDKGEIEAIAFDRPALQAIIRRDSSSKYHLMDIKYNPQFYAFGLSKKLPRSLKDSINYSMLYQIEKMDWKVLLSESNLID